jgi:hypothetical protein
MSANGTSGSLLARLELSVTLEEWQVALEGWHKRIPNYLRAEDQSPRSISARSQIPSTTARSSGTSKRRNAAEIRLLGALSPTR